MHMAIDLRPECVERQEALDVERNHEMAGIGFLVLLGSGVLDVAPERGAVERPAQKPEHNRKPGALVGADRHEHAFRQALAVGDRLAVLAADHPADRQRPALVGVGADGAVRGDGGCDVEHDRRLLAGRDRDRDRIGAKQRLGTAPGRHEVGGRDRAVDADHAVLERDGGVGRAGARMVGAPHADPGDAGLARNLDGEIGGVGHHQMAHAIVAVDEGSSGSALQDLDGGARIEMSAPKQTHIAGEPEDAVRIRAR